MIKNKKLFIPIGIIILGIIYFIVMRGPVISYNKEKVLSDAEFYKEVAQFYLEDYKKNNCAGSVSYLNATVKDGIPKSACLSSPYQHDLIFSDEIYEKYKKMNNNFRVDKSSLAHIEVWNSLVIFGIESGRASIIYSADDKKPEYVNGGTDTDKEKDNYIEKITDNLYYGCWQN